MTFPCENIDPQYAGLKKRSIAMVLDLLIIAGYAIVLAILSTILIYTTSFELWMNTPIKQDIIAFSTLILPAVLYFALQESSSRQATIGKRKAGIKVINRDGGKLSIVQSLLRSGIKFLPWQMAHTTVIQIWAGNTSTTLLAFSIFSQVLVIFYIVCLWLSKRHRTPYDWVADTYVVKVNNNQSLEHLANS